jgi:hypothetical protein
MRCCRGSIYNIGDDQWKPCRRDKHGEDAGYHEGLLRLLSALYGLRVSAMVAVARARRWKGGYFWFICLSSLDLLLLVVSALDSGRLCLTCRLWD